ncbi:glycosyltransferase [Segetibacter koreensis]|uniref:glycosyltransferase n=1 Tax=Segetibacter koreensis TaxID=398037 RepID=UPI0003659B34|nr:glycosyltransferase [Segetibacter koreensis]
MTVSVVMCTYNGALYIKDQILSILAQTHPVTELLVFDDASTDNTVEIIKEIALKTPSVKLSVNNQNIGFIKNFEQAIKAAKGDVIAISDQDDLWVDTKIEKMIKAWKKESTLIYCNSIIFTDRPPLHPKRNKNFRYFEGTDARKIFMVNTVSGHAMLIKRQLLDLIFPFAEGVMYDWWIAVVAAYNGGVQHFDEILVFQRSHARNITVSSHRELSIEEERNAYKKFLIIQCQKFASAPNIPATHKAFLEEFTSLTRESLIKKFHRQLFLFILKNRLLLFNYKRKRISIFSHIKHSYIRAFNAKWKENTNEVLF